MKAIKFLYSSFVLIFLSGYAFSQTPVSFNDGLNAARSEGKKVLLYFFSPSDSWSSKTESEMASPKVRSELSKFVYVKLNADSKEKLTYNKKDYSPSELAASFGGTGFPTFVFLNPDGSPVRFKNNGEEASSISGFIGEDDLAELLNFFDLGKYKDSDLSTVFQN